jgi:hypothetical protein
MEASIINPPGSPMNGFRPQRFLKMDNELWLDVKQHMVEYNLDHSFNCK